MAADYRTTALENAAKEAPDSLLTTVVRTLEMGNRPLRGAFVARSLNALLDLADRLDESALGEAVSSGSDYEALVRALEAPGALEALRRQDSLLPARIRGLRARERLISIEGGAFTAEQAAQALGISRQAVDKRRQHGKLLAVSTGRRGYLYPAWQLVEGGVLPGLEDVLGLLRDHDPWMQLAFFVNGNAALGGDSPLVMLRRGNAIGAKRAARLYGEQVAA